MVSDLIFYLFLYYLNLSLQPVHPLDNAVVFFDPDRKLIDFLLDRDIAAMLAIIAATIEAEAVMTVIMICSVIITTSPPVTL